MQSRWMVRVSGAFAVLALLFAVGSPLVMAQNADSPEINKLLADAKDHAVLAENDADTLSSYTNSKLSWETHAHRLEMIKTHVNNLGKVVADLKDKRAEGSAWQQEAIDRIDPLLNDMAENLTATINHLNDNRAKVHMPPYRDYAKANYELAARTTAVISDLVEYGKAKAKSESLEQKLELPASGSGE
ncbi:hypothetical protein [Acidipila rosea]|uniref:Uncharacterized protein n=1 Tax=Acidipila rosea TaxID=768535 RepID=A0A4R1L6F8_9BACT|nr:hypothetical protein [Acidipila rosea]MBW4026258.1 hypothetical protein [Acidobacteriota bacterium]MBW4044606.1 hypothetical protein [Acidobacteriota bacterium]TCK72777.1 hypothetical protein C7378_2367 [Acidipila rosea]